MNPLPLDPEDLAAGADRTPSQARWPSGGLVQPIDTYDPSKEIGAGILGPDPLPPVSDEERKRNSEGWRKLIAEYEAEHGAFTEEELAEARAKLSICQP